MIALDPQQTTEFSLAAHAEYPEATRLMFKTRFITGRQSERMNAATDEAPKLKTTEESRQLLIKSLDGILIGWRNAPVPFSLEAIPDVLTDFELYDLCREIGLATMLAELDKKKSRLRSSSPGESASTGTATTATA
jgi:hypothetical protein